MIKYFQIDETDLREFVNCTLDEVANMRHEGKYLGPSKEKRYNVEADRIEALAFKWDRILATSGKSE